MIDKSELRRVAAFADLPDDQIEWFLSQSQETHVAAGETYVRAGDPAEWMFVILEGQFQWRGEFAGEIILFSAKAGDVTGVLPWINANAHPGERVWLHEVNGLSFRDYQRNGMLRLDVVPAGGPEDADLAAVQYHQEFREQEVLVWQAFGTQVPAMGLYLDETPQVVVYRRPSRDRR